MIFFPMHFLGMQGMPRRYPDFTPAYAYWNHIATIGYMVMAASIVIWLINIAYAFTMGKKAEGNYWGSNSIATLEWTLSSPPPFHQFETLPVIKDEGHHVDQAPGPSGRLFSGRIRHFRGQPCRSCSLTSRRNGGGMPMSTPATHNAARRPADWRDFFALTKPRVMTLVIFTGLCGLLARRAYQSGAWFCDDSVHRGGRGRAAALNQWWEADIDAGMKRTAKRPLPSGRMERRSARDFGVALSGLSVMTMGLAAGWLCAPFWRCRLSIIRWSTRCG
jgi:heme O synthase-like polyprenyltransferase